MIDFIYDIMRLWKNTIPIYHKYGMLLHIPETKHPKTHEIGLQSSKGI